MIIIGLTGFKGSGKSTIAKYLEKEHGFTRLNFKDSLIEEMRSNFPDTLKEIAEASSILQQYETGIGESFTVEDLFELKPPLMRALMSNYGTEVRRKDNVDYWVNQYKKKLNALTRVVTDDVRFWNEYQAVKDNGGIIIRIERDDINDGGTHQSETEQKEFIADFTVKGIAGSHKEIFEQIESILDTIKSNTD